MGIIRKQTIYSSLFIYTGFVIGAINILFLSNEKYFTLAEYGLTRVLIDVSLLLSTLCTVGTISVTYKFYPFYQSYLPKKKNDLPFLTIAISALGCLTVLIFTTVFKDNIVRKFGAKSPLFVTYYYLIYPLTITFAFLTLFEAYAWSLRKTIISNFLKEVSFRLIVLILILLFIFKVISINVFFNFYAFIYIPGLLILLFVLIKSGGFPINFTVSSVTKRLKKRIISFGLFIFSGTVLNVLSKTSDVIIIASQSKAGLQDTAVFVTATYLITLMEVPQRGIVSIATPIIAEAWKDRNVKKISELYQKTSLNLLIIGFVIWGCLVLNMHNAIAFLGPKYAAMNEIVIVMGIAKLIDLGTGLNSQILLLSKFWKIDFITNMLFVLISIPLNYILINEYGVIGSAFANLVAMTVFNGIRFLYIWKLFKLQPFTIKTLYALLLAATFIVLIALIPHLSNIYIDAVMRSVLYVACFGGAILFFKVSEDMNGLYRLALQRINRSSN